LESSGLNNNGGNNGNAFAPASQQRQAVPQRQHSMNDAVLLQKLDAGKGGCVRAGGLLALSPSPSPSQHPRPVSAPGLNSSSSSSAFNKAGQGVRDRGQLNVDDKQPEQEQDDPDHQSTSVRAVLHKSFLLQNEGSGDSGNERENGVAVGGIASRRDRQRPYSAANALTLSSSVPLGDAGCGCGEFGAGSGGARRGRPATATTRSAAATEAAVALDGRRHTTRPGFALASAARKSGEERVGGKAPEEEGEVEDGGNGEGGALAESNGGGRSSSSPRRQNFGGDFLKSLQQGQLSTPAVTPAATPATEAEAEAATAHHRHRQIGVQGSTQGSNSGRQDVGQWLRPHHRRQQATASATRGRGGGLLMPDLMPATATSETAAYTSGTACLSDKQKLYSRNVGVLSARLRKHTAAGRL